MTPLRFFGRVLLLMFPTFTAWYLFSSFLAAPAVWLASESLCAWLPELVDSIYLKKGIMTVVSSLGEENGIFVPAETTGSVLAFHIDSRVLSYSIPFFASLHFATSLPGRWERFARGLIVLWLLMVPGLMSTALRDLLVTFGETFIAAPKTPPVNAVALAYQFNTLIIPPLAPIILWAWHARHSPSMKVLSPVLFSVPGEEE